MIAPDRLIVPDFDEDPWPTLGPEMCDFLESNMVHGPGDLLGEPIELTDEERLFLYRVYEVWPRGSEHAGRRRFKRATYSRRKGARKTEFAAWIAIAESHPEAPVRADGFRKVDGMWVPVGRGVRDPYIPMLAVTEEQTEDLAYGAVYAILTQDTCPLVDEYDVTLERVAHRSGGKMEAKAGAPNARDGARTTFQHFDETHLYMSPRLRGAHATMLRNIPKRKIADPWSLETTTMYGPGEHSIGEDAHKLAEAIHRGEVDDGSVYFDHRQASEGWDIAKKDQRERFIVEASGDAIDWADTKTISDDGAKAVRQGTENEYRRYWGNQPRRSSKKWHPVVALWGDRKVDELPNVIDGHANWPAADTPVVLAFDGSYNRDSTGLIGATVEAKPYIFRVNTWERPLNRPEWRTPRNEVDDEVAAAMERWQVIELAPDPPGWHREIEDWEQIYEPVVVRFDTNQPSRMGPACDDFEQATSDAELCHDGSEVLIRHLDHAVPQNRRGYTIVTKQAPDSEDRIDAIVAAIVAHHRARWHHTNGTVAPQTLEGSLMVGPGEGTEE